MLMNMDRDSEIDCDRLKKRSNTTESQQGIAQRQLDNWNVLKKPFI